ncbi:nucleoside-specific channel-forming protein Tsx [Trinickia symbiotica]|uniref:Nucleoside-specific channel-forming protein Tsx n=1 Tax=Trinickia symbiotica TaxID=863227 RepID=A0A2T3XQK1_9BURK|nr:nucleoside-specific channel-forming protein Tsx [Trinickia symbiotica]PTB18794.1 nucleoside-specific channel-forming protein Tsx [Trinickia symbiotica]
MNNVFPYTKRMAARRTKLALSASAICIAGLTGIPSTTRADEGAEPTTSAPAASPYLSDWIHQSIGVVGSKDIRFGPYKVNDVYAEYEYWGRKGPFDLYGYVDVPRTFGVGNSHDGGYTNKGSPLFTEQEPRISIDHLVGRSLAIGPVKEWYVAFDWIYDQGHNTAGRQNTLYAGLGTDLAAPGKMFLSANFYARRQFENYGAPNANSFDGFRFQMKYGYPLGTYWGGNLSYFGFFNYDFGSRLAEQTQGVRSDNAFVATNVLNYEFKHLRFWTAARYFHNGGQWAGKTLDFGDGPFANASTGWGWYAYVGYRF